MTGKEDKDLFDNLKPYSRSELNKNKATKKKVKKNKLDNDPEFQQFLKEDVKSEEVIKDYKKKKRKRNAILFVICILALISAGAGTYYYLFDTKLQQEETIASLEKAYPEVFVDEDKTEIVSNLPSKQYKHIKTLFDKAPNGTEKIEFTKYQTVLDEQYTNQQAAKKAIKELKTEDGKYLSDKASEKQFDVAYEKVKMPFNKEYMKTLTLNIDELKVEFDKVTLVKNKVNSFYKDGKLQEFTSEDWEKIKEAIKDVKNPKLNKILNEQYKSAHEEWDVREGERKAQKEKEEAEARKLAKEQAIKDAEEAKIREEKEAEQRKEEAKMESIREQARLEVEAEMKEEQKIKDAQEAKEQAEQEKLEAELRKKEEQDKKNEDAKIGKNKIGINGNYSTYISLGSTTNTNTIQESIDAGNIVSSLTPFNGDDGQTTYFGGHNPGPLSFMEPSVGVGSTVTVTDSSGKPTRYKMVEKVNTDSDGQDIIQYTGQTALDLYKNGSGEESILLQFCNTDNSLMSYWYGVKE